MRIFSLLAFLLFTGSAFAQLLEINIPEHRFRIDPYNKIIVVQKQDLQEFSDLTSFSEIDLILTDFEFTFVDIPENLEFTGWYIVNNGSDDYNLFFTQLPLIKIQSSGNIPDAPKIPAEFYYADADQVLVSTIGIERRGGVSQAYPKKSYGIEFWEDETGEVKVNVQFGNMRVDDDWQLHALYNEPLRLRSKTAHQLWLDIHKPYYLQQKPNAKSGVDVQYVELFLNGRYNGVYMMTERIDRKLLKVEHFDGNINGEIYKGVDHGPATNYSGLPNFSNTNREWAGYRYNYPKVNEITDWQNIYDFTGFVINSTDAEFESIWTKFNFENYSDYFIFLNLLRATDNQGKNIYTARLNSHSPYFYVPWDLDGIFGIIWDGSNANITDDILGNGFTNRVIATNVNNYSEAISARWFELREGALHPDSIISRLNDSYDLLKSNNVYAREALVFPNYPFDQESFDYMANWISERIVFLDIYFGYEPNALHEISQKKNFVYPVPARSEIYLAHSVNYQNKRYSIYNTQGQAVKAGNITRNAIDISSIAAGFYIFKAGNFTQKIIIE